MNSNILLNFLTNKIYIFKYFYYLVLQQNYTCIHFLLGLSTSVPLWSHIPYPTLQIKCPVVLLKTWLTKWYYLWPTSHNWCTHQYWLRLLPCMLVMKYYWNEDDQRYHIRRGKTGTKPYFWEVMRESFSFSLALNFLMMLLLCNCCLESFSPEKIHCMHTA